MLPALDLQPEAHFIDAARACGAPIVPVNFPDGSVLTTNQRAGPTMRQPFKTWPDAWPQSHRIAARYAAALAKIAAPGR